MTYNPSFIPVGAPSTETYNGKYGMPYDFFESLTKMEIIQTNSNDSRRGSSMA